MIFTDNQITPRGNQADSSTAFIIAIIVIIVLAFIILVLSVKLYKANSTIRTLAEAASQSTSPRTSQPEEESEHNPSENVKMLALSVDESQSAQTVQESKIDHKSSSTQPF